MDAGMILLGKATVRSVPRMINLPTAGFAGLAVQTGAALLGGAIVDQIFGSRAGSIALAGGLSAPLENIVVSMNIPFISPALSTQAAETATQGYMAAGGNNALSAYPDTGWQPTPLGSYVEPYPEPEYELQTG